MICKTTTEQESEVISIADSKAMWDYSFKDNHTAALIMTHISFTEKQLTQGTRLEYCCFVLLPFRISIISGGSMLPNQP